jgi:biotin carboxyl carrier protein
MKLIIELDGKPRTVELSRGEKGFSCSIDGVPVEADIAEIYPGAYSILIGGRSFEAHIDPHIEPHIDQRANNLLVSVAGREYSATVQDPREWKRKRGGSVASEGRQQVLAPMPGKVVRVLAKAGDKIEAGQGILVVEAMKMQNEVRAPKSGQVERILVAEGQSVNVGEVLAVVS